MKPETKENILKAISMLRENFQKQADPDSWATNIQKACAHLQCREEWVHFYHYLSSPSTYNMDKVTLEKEDPSPMVIENFKFEGLDNRLEPIVYKNGTDVTIHIKRRANSMSDEKQMERD